MEKGKKMSRLNEVENSYLDYIKDINCHPILTFEEEQDLGKKTKKGDKNARAILIRSNLKLVVKIAIHYYKPKYNLMDLIQEGNIGLIIAVDKFNHRKKFRFSTYSSWWIKHYITRSILKKEFHINMPLRKVELLFKLEKSIYSLFQKFERIPKLDELVKDLGVRVEKIKEIMKYTSPILSLDSAIGPNNDMSLMDIISSRDIQPDELVFNSYLLEYELNILETLIKRDAEIIKYRYGFYDGKNLTLKEASKLFGISPEAIRQIELRTLKKIRLNHRDLKDYLIN